MSNRGRRVTLVVDSTLTNGKVMTCCSSRSSSIESDTSVSYSKKQDKEDSTKSSDYESVEYHSAVESVCSSSFSSSSRWVSLTLVTNIYFISLF